MLSDSKEDGGGKDSHDEIDDFLKVTFEVYSTCKTDNSLHYTKGALYQREDYGSLQM